jgi:hypothetical protein
MEISELNITPYNNYVIVKPHMDMEKGNVSGLAIDTSFNPHEHAPRVGIVVSVPETLHFDENDTSGMPWKTSMEIEEGDEVTYHYLSAMVAEDPTTPKFFEFNGEKYYFIKYDRVFTAKRLNGLGRAKLRRSGMTAPVPFPESWYDIVCLNGFVLVEPISNQEDEQYRKWLEIPDKKDATLGRISHVGSCISNYGAVYADYHGPDMDDLVVGDVVAMDRNCNIPLQYKFHANIKEDKEFYRVQRRYVLAKISE